ncbi:MAG: fluoride efflux transporter CrcB [Saprospiraceae bacterium]
MLHSFALVFLGGGAGSACRYALWLAMRPWHDKFPWATFAANAAACLILGLLLGWQAQGLLSDQRRLLFATGFCGGLSTYSTFTAETWGLWQNGSPAAALANVFGQLVVCVACLLAGLRMAA